METISVEEDIILAPAPQSPLSSPTPLPKKLKRLRKVRTPAEEEHSAAIATENHDNASSCKQLVAEMREGELAAAPVSQRESAEEILRRFGKGGRAGEDEGLVDGGKKRKAVQTTIRAAVVDMAKESSTRGEEARSVEGDSPAMANMEVAEGDPELGSQPDQDGAPQELPAPSKRRRSETVKRCSVLATSMTLAVDYKENSASEDEIGAMDSEEEGSGNSTGLKDDDQDGGADERIGDGTDEAEEGGGGGGWNAGWSDGLDGEGESMESILAKARKMVAEMSNVENGSVKTAKENKRSGGDDLAGIENPSGKKKKGKKEDEKRTREEMYAESQRLLRESKGVAFMAPQPVVKPVSSVLEKIRQRRLQLGCSRAGTMSPHNADTKPELSITTKELRSSTLSCRSLTHVDLTVDEDTDVEIEVFSSIVVKTEEAAEDMNQLNAVQGTATEEELLPAPVPEERVPEEMAGEYETPATPESRTEPVRADQALKRTDSEDLVTEPVQSDFTSQELLCNSQLSPGTEESPKATPPDHHLVAGVTDLMGLDTELQDEGSLQRVTCEDRNKENRDPGLRVLAQSEVYTSATHVRGLIDDEAEDEDEDLLAENAEEEEAFGDGEDLQDLIASTQKEKAGDRARRAALHRKWLDQQDTEQTEDILERLRTGRSSRWKGRDRVVSCLDDEDDDLGNARGLCEALSDDENADDLNVQSRADVQPEEEEEEEDLTMSLHERLTSPDQETDCLLDVYEDPVREDHEIEGDKFVEDEEEHEKSVIRKRLLEESEEQLAFLSPAEDESSREVFGLINKVNVASLKTKPASGHGELRLFGSASCSSLPSKPSFLGRSSSSSSLQPPAHRQGSSGGSRSFVFGRDDSNSNHGFPSPNQAQEDKKARHTPATPAQSTASQGERSSAASAPTHAKRGEPSAAGAARPSGPSLFELLRRQAAEPDPALPKAASTTARKWGNNAEAFSVFAPKSFSLSRRKP